MGLFKATSLLTNRFNISQIINNFIKMGERQLANDCIVQSPKINRLEKPKIVSCSEPLAVDCAVKLLVSGEVIALPTDTVYGVACNANDCAALRHLYDIKARNEAQPIAICVSDLFQFRQYTLSYHLSDDLLNDLLPGPVTIILYKSNLLNSPFLNPGIEKIGIRIPDHKFIRTITKLCGFPLALTSANLRGEPSSLTISEFSAIWNKLPAIFDGGNISEDPKSRAASTMVDLSKSGCYKILREGMACQETENVLRKYDLKKI